MVHGVAAGLALAPYQITQLLVTGGGRHNPTVMGALKAALDCSVAPVEAHGFDGDMIEAQAFAYLAARSLRGLALTGPGTTGVSAPLTGGRLSQP